jgi:four helix bundle protein
MKIQQHTDLDVYRKGFDAAMLIFWASKNFPKVETYSLTDQIRRSSRSVCANLAEAWRKRRYKAAFIAKLSDAESEADQQASILDNLAMSSLSPDLHVSLSLHLVVPVSPCLVSPCLHLEDRR